MENLSANREWSSSTDIYVMFQFLKQNGKLDRVLWRTFHNACCKDIWDYITDARSRAAVEISANYLLGRVSQEEMRRTYVNAKHVVEDKWTDVQSLRLPGEPNTSIWPISQDVDDAWVSYSAAEAAMNCVLDASDEVLFTTIPDAAASVRAWAMARVDILRQFPDIEGEELRALVLKKWEDIYLAEELRQAQILRRMVDKMGVEIGRS